MAQAFIADRVVTPQGTRRAALLLEDGPSDGAEGVIRAVCDVGDLPASADVIDFGGQEVVMQTLARTTREKIL